MDYQGVDIPIEQEREAIKKFLDRYWDVSIKGSLDQAIDGMLEYAARIGISSFERDLKGKISFHNAFIQRYNSLEGVEPMEEIDFSPVYDHGTEWGKYEAQRKAFEKHFHESTQPLDLQRYTNEDWTNDLEFEGTPLHLSAAAVAAPFVESMGTPKIASYAKKGLSPVQLLGMAIFNQGSSLGMYAIEKKYGTREELTSKGFDVLEKIEQHHAASNPS